MSPINWQTTDDIDWSHLLHDYEVRGLTMEQIAYEYGCSTFPVFLKLHELGAKIRKPGRAEYYPDTRAEREVRNDQILAESEAGATQAQLAQSWGYSQGGINSMVQEARRRRSRLRQSGELDG